MKKKFGVDIVYFGGADKPRGYFVVDHKNKQVCKGSEVLKLSELMMFESAEDKVKRIDAFLDMAFENNPQLTGIELHRLLKKYYAAGYKGAILPSKRGFSPHDTRQAVVPTFASRARGCEENQTKRTKDGQGRRSLSLYGNPSPSL